MRIAEFLVMDIQPATGSAAIREGLLADHQFLEQQIERLMSVFEANDQPQMQALWTEFDARLMAHLDTEEKHLIPALEKRRERDARAILEEHEHIRGRVAELGTGIDLHVVRLDALRSFIDELRAHARSEDRLLYRWADEHFDEAAKSSLLANLSHALRGRLQGGRP